MKRIVGLLLAVVLAGAFAIASQARSSASSSRTHALHAVKTCPQDTYHGQPGGYCTITSSNVGAIPAGAKVFYFEAVAGGQLDSDLVLYAGPGNVAFGHVTLTFGTVPSGVITFRGGRGDFRGFRATVDVTYDPQADLWHWDGTYRFVGHGH
jgi:hypothetical protein